MAPRERLKVLKGNYGIARLASTDPVPHWADGIGFVSITRTEDELSVVCRQERIPHNVQSDLDWSCLKLQGPFPFNETGIVLSVIQPISSNGMGVFVVSTFDGDHVLVKSDELASASGFLRVEGHLVD